MQTTPGVNNAHSGTLAGAAGIVAVTSGPRLENLVVIHRTQVTSLLPLLTEVENATGKGKVRISFLDGT